MNPIDSDKQKEAVPLEFDYKSRHYKGEAKPVTASCSEDVCFELDVTLNNEHIGTIWCGRNMQWKLRGAASQDFVDKIGSLIALWYE